MSLRTRHTTRRARLGSTVAMALALMLAGVQGAAAQTGHATAVLRRTQALQRVQDAARATCGRRTGGWARCLAMELVPRGSSAGYLTRVTTAQTQQATPARSAAAGEFGLRPQDLHSAYQLPTSAVGSQTIALVDAYNDPDAEADLASYSKEFGLPECTAANECFEQLNQEGASGDPPFPKTVKELESALKGSKRVEAEEASGWSVEISLDIETAHAVCESCHIALVEANTPSYGNLEAAENAAASAGAEEISNSWGGSESGESSSAFNHPGLVITAAAGDEGYLDWLEPSGPSETDFPASSPQVVAVGGTRLAIGAEGEWAGETVWNDGGEDEGEKEGVGATGGGCSAQFTAPAWQQAVADWSQVGCGDKRAVSDVSADADPYSGVAVYDSLEECGYFEGRAVRYSHWCTIGGTSLATPLIAATFALAGGAAGVEYPARTVYENVASTPGSLHDVTTGSNGECAKPFDEATGESGCTAAEEAASCAAHAICLARSGYDGPTGLGTPDGLSAFLRDRRPTVSTGAASARTQTTAQLNASVNPNGLAVSACRFEYGTASVSEASAPCEPMPGAGGNAEAVSAQLGALSVNTTYRFRVVATNADGTGTGETQTFATLPYAPTVEAGGEAAVQETSATVYASVNPHGGELSECVFQYGVASTPSDGYEASVPCSPAPGAASDAVAVSGSLAGLQPNTSYRYRVLARNGGGLGEDGEQAFTTLAAPPAVSTGTASEVTQTSATLAASVNPNGEQVTACAIEYGRSTEYGLSAPCTPSPGAGSSAIAVSAPVAELAAGTEYYFRVSATNTTGTAYGDAGTFTTDLPTTLAHLPLSQEPASSSPQASSSTQGSGASSGGSPASTSTSRPAPVPDAQLTASTLVATAKGVVSVTVRCPADVPSCTGTVVLRTMSAVLVTTHGGQRKAQVLTLASERFTVAGGKTTTVRLRLSASGRALVNQERALQTRATVFARDPAGTTHTWRAPVTIRATRSG
ncbi:MAG TPA: hypothetical protein VMD79_09815 [Solirubrobacteraceae bacterium]|nr:hypothetical protein [Solirubrobacteraceae bacterium]